MLPVDELRCRLLPNLKLPEVDGLQGLQPHVSHTDRAHGKGRRYGFRPVPASEKSIRALTTNLEFTDALLGQRDQKLENEHEDREHRKENFGQSNCQ